MYNNAGKLQMYLPVKYRYTIHTCTCGYKACMESKMIGCEIRIKIRMLFPLVPRAGRQGLRMEALSYPVLCVPHPSLVEGVHDVVVAPVFLTWRNRLYNQLLLLLSIILFYFSHLHPQHILLYHTIYFTVSHSFIIIRFLSLPFYITISSLACNLGRFPTLLPLKACLILLHHRLRTMILSTLHS